MAAPFSRYGVDLWGAAACVYGSSERSYAPGFLCAAAFHLASRHVGPAGDAQRRPQLCLGPLYAQGASRAEDDAQPPFVAGGIQRRRTGPDADDAELCRRVS